MRIELPKDYGIYLAEVAISLHESGHAAGLLQIAAEAEAEGKEYFPYFQYAELRDTEKSLGMTYYRTWHHPISEELLDQDKHAFHTACGIVMSDIYFVPGCGYQTDMKCIQEYCATCPDSDEVEKKLFEDASQFLSFSRKLKSSN